VEGADLSRVSGTPTFFVNGRRHHGAYDIDTLSRAVRAAGARGVVALTCLAGGGPSSRSGSARSRVDQMQRHGCRVSADGEWITDPEIS
jgi:hypothetical protein